MLRIRSVEKTDIEIITEAEHLIFGEGWSHQMFDEELSAEGAYLTIAEKDGTFCGYASVRIITDFAELFKIAVLPAFRKKGIAQLLYNDVESHSRQSGAASILLEVRQDNAAAVSFYRKNGFTQTGLRKNYYGDCSAVLMEKVL